MAETYITRAGYQKLQEDLKGLKSQKKGLSNDIDRSEERRVGKECRL